MVSKTSTTDSTLRVGSTGDAVKTVQRRLKELGYYKSSIDGSYGSVTAAAVKAFQTKNGLTADGVCGEDTLEKLNSSSAKGANDSTSTTTDSTLRVGSTGDAVKTVQRRLKELGYYKNSIDGSYGSVTAAAVKAFQTKNGLTADGVCGEDTLEKLNSSSAKGANDSDSSETELDTDQTLSPGDDNAQVKAMKLLLKELGYYSMQRQFFLSLTATKRSPTIILMGSSVCISMVPRRMAPTVWTKTTRNVRSRP